jgi:HPt (histidine-containing phosphotransfer) domain-containing protein
MNDRTPRATEPGSIVSDQDDVLCADVVRQLWPLERASPGVIGSIIATFLETQDEFVDAAARALASVDFDAVRRGAHKLKGGAGSLGALRLSAAAAALESAATAADSAATRVELERVIVEYRGAAAALVAAFDPGPGS